MNIWKPMKTIKPKIDQVIIGAIATEDIIEGGDDFWIYLLGIVVENMTVFMLEEWPEGAKDHKLTDFDFWIAVDDPMDAGLCLKMKGKTDE